MHSLSLHARAEYASYNASWTATRMHSYMLVESALDPLLPLKHMNTWYEYFKKEWARIKGAPLAPWQGSLCGSVAGGIAAAITTPLDVVKTRLMTQAAGSAQYSGVADCLRQVIRDEGAAALWTGVVPRMTSIAFGGAIFFGAYEYAKAALEARSLNAARAKLQL
eukprot:13455-Heterococcus_DN1.PRE.1